jgi:hypothetical protein
MHVRRYILRFRNEHAVIRYEPHINEGNLSEYILFEPSAALPGFDNGLTRAVTHDALQV